MATRHAKHGTTGGEWGRFAASLRARSGIVALLALAAFLGFSYFAGRTRMFVAGSYVWLTPATAMIILAMTAAQLMAQRRTPCGCACHGHQPVRIPPAACTAAILLGIGFAVTVNPRQYSADGVEKRRVSLPARDSELETAIAWILDRDSPGQAAAPTPAPLAKNPTVIELLEAAAATPRSALEGQFVTVVGQCILRDGPSQQRFDVYRLVVTCCVADATAVAVEVARNTAETLDPGGWVSVGGVLKFDSQRNSSMPVIHAATVSKIAEPSSPYL